MKDFTIEITEAAETDLSEIERVERECFSVPWTAEQLRAYLPDEHHELLAAKKPDGSVTGYVGMMYVLDEGYISNVAVRPTYRRQGIGDGLIDRLLAFAALRELSFVTLEVRESNAAAIALYAKNGFRTVGIRKNYYEKPRENAILMTKFLKEMTIN